MKKVRLGIIGVSWWTEVVYPGFARATNAEITWVASRREDRVRAFAEQHAIPNWTTDVGRMLCAGDVDAVFVGVPNFLHEEMAIAAISQGKHVLQEKPMALSTEKALAQCEVAKSRGVVLSVNQILRMVAGVRDLPALFRDTLGPLRKLNISLVMTPTEWTGWRADPKLSGGTLFEMAIHQLDLARWLFGRNPQAVWATGADIPGHDMTVILDFGEGDSAIVDFCWRSAGFHQRILACGEKGFVTQALALPVGRGHQTITTAHGAKRSEFQADALGPATFQRMLEGFAQAILEGTEPPVPAWDGVWAVRIAEASRRALREGKPISL